ncbi:glycosyltransferase family 2 protein [Acidisoma silvae]|uniref:Glycosyltransferase family 2 protein n=1 Tax=Acidisoma silvae TaxID=2802396 RepID=A0A964E224_9PROT|nr:glycosyltransferase family 2 protein [Acidisoma silvae]MCB8878373.1 glycosyltransferase family 2 protein [Acidisoma silvae]
MPEDRSLPAGVRPHPQRHILPVDGEEVVQIRARVAALEQALDHSREAERVTAIERDALLASFSWRAMAPVRRLTDAWRNLRKPAPVAVAPPPVPELPPGLDYGRWLRDYHSLSGDDRAAILAHIDGLPARPTIAIVIPIDQETVRFLPATVLSIRAQLYAHWEICIAGTASSLDQARSLTPKDATGIRYILSRGSSAAFAAALPQIGSDFVTLMAPGDRLADEALYEVAATLNDYPDSDLIYTDEDCINAAGRRFAPAFKSAWNIDLHLGQNLTGRLTVYRRSLLQRFNGTALAGEHDLALAVASTSLPSRIRHIPSVLYHRLMPDGPAPGLFDPMQPPAWTQASRTAAETYLTGKGLSGRAELLEWSGAAAAGAEASGAAAAGAEASGAAASGAATRLQLRWPLPDPAPRVSLILPTRDNHALLARCAAGLLHRTDYPDIELIIIDNDSRQADTLDLLSRLQQDRRVRVLPYRAPFNYSAINNMAVAQATGDVILLINDDIDVIDGGWLREMVALASRPDIGAVGAKLFYGDGRIQHAGVILGVGQHNGRGGIAGHFGHGTDGNEPGYLDQYALTREVSAVTAACMALRREVFTAVGGFDAEHLPIAYNDVDLCLRIRAQGLRVVWTPFATLFHLESQSRGRDMTPEQLARAAREATYMRDRWDHELNHDPFYNPNFDWDYPMQRLAEPPRRPKPWRAAAP